ncbi:MAG: hypothetical protein ACREJ2_08290, partial [Planctomycetota bacterium]
LSPAGKGSAAGSATRRSCGMLLPLAQQSELIEWIGLAPPPRWQGLRFAVLPDVIWIDSLADASAELPPFLAAERLTPHGGSIGATVWLASGTRWDPPLAVDLLLERLQAEPDADYILRPDPGGALRCRYCLERSRLLPLDRVTVRTVLRPLEPLA